MPTSAAAELWDVLAAEAAAESPLWREALRDDAERTPVFSPLVAERYAFGLETIYEGYLVHYGRSRLFAPGDRETALLVGDYLYAHGLARIAAVGDLDAVAALAELISACAALRADGRPGDGEAWVATARVLGDPDSAAVDVALAAHAARLGKIAP